MDLRAEISLDELLAEPMVLALMKQDGVQIGEARSLYVSVGQRLKDNAGHARQHVTNARLPRGGTGGASDQCNVCDSPLPGGK
jgi:hypothetical protein